MVRSRKPVWNNNTDKLPFIEWLLKEQKPCGLGTNVMCLSLIRSRVSCPIALTELCFKEQIPAVEVAKQESLSFLKEQLNSIGTVKSPKSPPTLSPLYFTACLRTSHLATIPECLLPEDSQRYFFLLFLPHPPTWLSLPSLSPGELTNPSCTRLCFSFTKCPPHSPGQPFLNQRNAGSSVF